MPSRFWRASGNALLPGCNVLGAAGGGAFTPASISGLNFWIEAQDSSRIYSDNGTTPVVANDPIYLWKDKSSAARDVSQTTLGARPLYKTDLSKPSILFDGVASAMASGNSLSWDDGSGQHWFAVSAQWTANTREVLALSQSGVYLGDIYVNASVHMEIENAAAAFQEATQSTVTSGTPFVAIGTVATGVITAYLDNVAGTPNSSPGTLRTDSVTMVVGGNNNFNGRIFAACHGSGTLSSSDRANLQTYLAALHP